jgi:hypothetical protein
MAISKNLLMNGVTGSINKQIVLRRYEDRTVVSAYPDMSGRKLSPKQKRINELMTKANEQVQDIIADEKQRNEAILRLNVKRNKLYTSLISEYFKNALAE